MARNENNHIVYQDYVCFFYVGSLQEDRKTQMERKWAREEVYKTMISGFDLFWCLVYIHVELCK